MVQVHDCLVIVPEPGEVIPSSAAGIVIPFHSARTAGVPQPDVLHSGLFRCSDEFFLMGQIHAVVEEHAGALLQKSFVYKRAVRKIDVCQRSAKRIYLVDVGL